MFWFNKNHPNAVYSDIREVEHELCDGRTLTVSPDVVADFRNLPFDDESFHLVVFDPPHMVKLSETTWMAKKYGTLLPTWETDIRSGFEECMRVLKENGTLIFKWNEAQVTLNKVLSAIGTEPLFGHVTGKHGRTIWIAFMKGVTKLQTP